jgi:serine/threonine-protein kinase
MIFPKDSWPMSRATRIEQLLEQLLDSQSTPEEVCREAPELLWEVRQRWQRVRSVEAQIDAMFPPSGPIPPYRDRVLRPPDPPLPDIAGYELEGMIARGGMGVVYKARHLKLNRRVALKMLLAGPYASAAELARFMREAEAVAGLTHPNIVQVHDVGDLDGRPYYTMEFIEGGTLAQKLAGMPQPAAQSATLVATLADAMRTAHQQGIIHRDLKPGNVLLTADGTPKITDFGLARHFDGEGNLTLSGVRIGTPSYMSPEQASGRPSAVGPAADIYSLGAILYEMLTGRPPFRAETPSETQRQVITEEPVPPARLNAKVPRDLETICLKCLRKDPARRYESAGALSEDLQRFLKREPIVARPIGWLERSVKWARRRPALATALAGAVMLSLLLIGGGMWLAYQRGQLKHAVEADLNDVGKLQAEARWNDARVALERAEARLGRGGPNELRQRFIQATNDLDLVMKLDAVRLSRITSGQLVVYKLKANEQYAAAFKGARMGSVGDDPEAVASRVKASAVHAALVAALDDWAVCATDAGQRSWILDVARRADPDPKGWRDRLCDNASWDDSAALAELMQAMPLQGRSLPLLLAVGDRLKASGGDPTPFLRRVQQEHPDDFWANLALGNALLFRLSAEARGYYRAALSSRPETAIGYCVVGDSLRLEGSLDQAIHYYRKSIEHDAKYARGYTNLGLALQTQGKLDEAIDYYRKSLQIDPDYAWSYYNLGNTLRAQGHDDAALE